MPAEVLNYQCTCYWIESMLQSLCSVEIEDKAAENPSRFNWCIFMFEMGVQHQTKECCLFS